MVLIMIGKLLGMSYNKENWMFLVKDGILWSMLGWFMIEFCEIEIGVCFGK